MINAKELFNNIPQTSKGLQQFQSELKDTVDDGFTDNLTAFACLTELHKAIQEVAESIKDEALKEAVQYSRATFEHKGFIFAAKKGGRMYDFSNCGDEVLETLTESQNKTKERIKARQTMLKALRESKHKFNEETGEVYEIHPPVVTYKKDSLTVKLNG